MDKNNKIRKLIEDYLKEAKLMQLATSVDHQPWVCNVWFATDSNLNIYWISSTTRRHSHEVIINKKVAGAVALPQTPADTARGVQFQGTAEILTKKLDIAKATLLFSKKIFSKALIIRFMKDRSTPHRFYRIKPTQFVLFDMVNFPDHSRQEFHL